MKSVESRSTVCDRVSFDDLQVSLQVLEQWNALFELFQILAHGGPRSRKPKLRTLGPQFPGKAGGSVRKSRCSQRRSGQKTWRNGNRVRQDKRKEPHSTGSLRVSHCPMTSRAGRRKENAGREESRLRNQRRRVEGSGTRSGSLRCGTAVSQEPGSRKYRRSASLRAIRLKWV
jgi:hypothetical protein